MLLSNKIIKHYSKILFEYVESSVKKNEDRELIFNQIKKINFIINRNFFLKKFLNNYFPLINSQKKVFFFKKIFSSFNPVIINLFKILILRKREFFFEKILLEYQKIYKKIKQGYVECTIVSFYPLNEETKNIITNNFFNNCKNIHVFNKIDKSIIGGFILLSEYKEWNFSIKKKISSLKNFLK